MAGLPSSEARQRHRLPPASGAAGHREIGVGGRRCPASDYVGGCFSERSACFSGSCDAVTESSRSDIDFVEFDYFFNEKSDQTTNDLVTVEQALAGSRLSGDTLLD